MATNNLFPTRKYMSKIHVKTKLRATKIMEFDNEGL